MLSQYKFYSLIKGSIINLILNQPKYDSTSFHFSHTALRDSYISSFMILTYLNSLDAKHYVHQDSCALSCIGTRDHPYNSLDQAITSLGSGTFEIVLLGDEAIVSSFVTVPSGSNYTIR